MLTPDVRNNALDAINISSIKTVIVCANANIWTGKQYIATQLTIPHTCLIFWSIFNVEKSVVFLSNDIRGGRITYLYMYYPLIVLSVLFV